MRLISQDGKFDIPYDEIVVELFGECVVGRLKEYIGRDIILGAYSTDEKAQKAMEMLRTAYVGLPILFQNVDIGLIILLQDVRQPMFLLQKSISL